MITVGPEPLDAPDSASLLDELATELHQRYGHDSEPGPKLSVGDIAVFLVARDQTGRAVGCTALKLSDPMTGEIKRMYVRPTARGHGLARRLLEELEGRAGSFGVRRLVLETGLAPRRSPCMSQPDTTRSRRLATMRDRRSRAATGVS